MFNPENAAGTVQFISKLAVQKISGITNEEKCWRHYYIASQIHKTSIRLAFVHYSL